MPKLVSLSKNLVHNGNFTLEDVIATKPDEYATHDCSVEAKVKIHQARRSIEIDQEVVDALRKQFGIMPLGRAIRLLLGLKPKVFQDAWQEEEDRLIREHYPTTGSRGLTEFLGRSADCIRTRASILGVKRQWIYKRDRRKKTKENKQ